MFLPTAQCYSKNFKKKIQSSSKIPSTIAVQHSKRTSVENSVFKTAHLAIRLQKERKMK